MELKCRWREMRTSSGFGGIADDGEERVWIVVFGVGRCGVFEGQPDVFSAARDVWELGLERVIVFSEDGMIDDKSRRT